MSGLKVTIFPSERYSATDTFHIHVQCKKYSRMLLRLQDNNTYDLSLHMYKFRLNKSSYDNSSWVLFHTAVKCTREKLFEIICSFVSNF